MAVNNTGALFKAFTFDGESSRNYGVYITGAAVYNAPQREVEMLSIPNRNGAFALDKGRFENIEVTYPAGIYADNETDFAEAVSNFRNFLCSRNGYCRLQDEYNPNEYRMAIYKSGLEVEPALLRAGEFELIFECMPQRFLTSGDTAITVTSGQTLTNPMRFDAKPLMMAKGHGLIDINDREIEIADIPLGDIVLLPPRRQMKSGTVNAIEYDASLVNNDDPITLTSAVMDITPIFTGKPRITNVTHTTLTKTESAGFTCGGYSVNIRWDSYRPNVYIILTLQNLAWTHNTNESGKGCNIDFSITVTFAGGEKITRRYLFSVDYYGPNSITFRVYDNQYIDPQAIQSVANTGELLANSSVSALGNPTYIDCDAGVCYKIVNGEYVSLDGTIDLGMDLPALVPGSNTITFDDTITDLKIKPRWWKI